MISSLFFDKDNMPNIKTYFSKNSLVQQLFERERARLIKRVNAKSKMVHKYLGLGGVEKANLLNFKVNINHFTREVEFTDLNIYK